MRNKLLELHGQTFIRYGLMAVTVVAIELATFWVINSVFGWHYLIATWVSLAIGILLNWIGSRWYVFGKSIHRARKEFLLVASTSLFGVLLQSLVVLFVVEALSKPALGGKVAAIIITFFWNYFIRKKYIYTS